MINTNIKDNKTANVIIAHYITAALSFFVICILIFASSKAFIGHYFHPKLLAITHITTLGWISIVIVGSLYQLAPVITNTNLYSIKLAIFTYACIVIGTMLLAISFWFFDIGHLIQTASIILLIGITAFLINIYLTTQQSKEKSIEADFIVASIFWFWLTAFLGTVLAFNFRYAFLSKEHLYFLKIHAHIGLLGWFLCLIIGVASKLIPMFLISGKLNSKLLNYSFYFLNIGLVGFTIDSLFFNGAERSFIYISLIIISVVSFIIYLKQAYTKRLKKSLDIGLKHSYIAFIFIAIPILLWLILKFKIIQDTKIQDQLSIAIAFSLMFGFIGLLILGQTFKNLSFIVWLKKYQKYSEKNKASLPKDLYSEKIAKMQLYAFLIGFIVTLAGIVISSSILISIGSIGLIGAAILYTINILKIALHQQKLSTTLNN
jgi:hypothetical protein